MTLLHVGWENVGLWKDPMDDSWHWEWPKFRFTNFIGRPCPTHWYYDWWLDLGIFFVAKFAQGAMTYK